MIVKFVTFKFIKQIYPLIKNAKLQHISELGVAALWRLHRGNVSVQVC